VRDYPYKLGHQGMRVTSGKGGNVYNKQQVKDSTPDNRAGGDAQ
jgi:hypothetical protein